MGGVPALGSLAGCGGPGSVVDSPDVFGHEFPYAPGRAQLNPWAPAYPENFYAMLFEVPSLQRPNGERRLTDLVERVTVDGPTVTVEYSDAFEWWNGEPVTARDQWVAERIQAQVETATAPSVELLDDYRLRYEFAEPLNRELALSRVAGDAHNVPAWHFESWAERLESATTDDERSDVVDRLHAHRVGLDEAMEMGFGCGPYELTEVSINRLMLERRADHPRADDVAIPRLWFPVVESLSTASLIRKGQLDGGRGRLRNVQGSAPGYIEQFAEYQMAGGTKLSLNWRNPHLARRGVRRAILSVLPLEAIVDNTDWGDVTAVQTGMTGPPARRWLDGSVRDRLHEYPVGADRELAAEYMRGAGYARDGSDKWRDDGDVEADLRIRAPTWSDWAASGELIASTLNQFGFDVDFSTVPNTRLYTDATGPDYDVFLWWMAGRPSRSYDVTATSPATVGLGLSGPDPAASDHGKPVEPAVPTEPGAVDAGDGGRERVNLVEQWERIRGPADEAGTADAVATFARWWNDALPDVCLATQVTGVWGNTRDFTWPAAEETPAYRWSGPSNQPEYHLLKYGAIGRTDDGA